MPMASLKVSNFYAYSADQCPMPISWLQITVTGHMIVLSQTCYYLNLPYNQQPGIHHDKVDMGFL